MRELVALYRYHRRLYFNRRTSLRLALQCWIPYFN
jgi:hypothetical protein